MKIIENEMLNLTYEGFSKKCVVLKSFVVCDTPEEVIIKHLCYDGHTLFILEEQEHLDLDLIHEHQVQLFAITEIISENCELFDACTPDWVKDEDMTNISLVNVNDEVCFI